MLTTEQRAVLTQSAAECDECAEIWAQGVGSQIVESASLATACSQDMMAKAAAIRAALDTIDELADSLADMVGQHCRCSDGTLDSFAESGPAEAMRLLADAGRLTITAEYGRREALARKDAP